MYTSSVIRKRNDALHTRAHQSVVGAAERAERCVEEASGAGDDGDDGTVNLATVVGIRNTQRNEFTCICGRVVCTAAVAAAVIVSIISSRLYFFLLKGCLFLRATTHSQ